MSELTLTIEREDLVSIIDYAIDGMDAQRLEMFSTEIYTEPEREAIAKRLARTTDALTHIVSEHIDESDYESGEGDYYEDEIVFDPQGPAAFPKRKKSEDGGSDNA